MVDFVKLWINDPELRLRLLEDPALSFQREKAKYSSKTKLRDFKFILHDSGRVEISGSLHKYYNNGLHNWNDFSRIDLSKVIIQLCEWLKILPNQAQLHNMEFGVNTTVPLLIKEISTDLISYKKDVFKNFSLDSGDYCRVMTADYDVKCYDKGNQYNLKYNLFRFEVKVKAMRYVKSLDIHTLEDLLDPKKITKLGKLLMQTWDYVLIREQLQETNLTFQEKEVIRMATNTTLYQNLNRKKRHEIRKKYKKIIDRYAENEPLFQNRKDILGKLIQAKFNDLNTKTEQLNLQNVDKPQLARPIRSEGVNLVATGNYNASANRYNNRDKITIDKIDPTSIVNVISRTKFDTEEYRNWFASVPVKLPPITLNNDTIYDAEAFVTGRLHRINAFTNSKEQGVRTKDIGDLQQIRKFAESHLDVAKERTFATTCA